MMCAWSNVDWSHVSNRGEKDSIFPLQTEMYEHTIVIYMYRKEGCDSYSGHLNQGFK